jgi:hypothetical protein
MHTFSVLLSNYLNIYYPIWISFNDSNYTGPNTPKV